MPQKHDTGWKKRRAVLKAKDAPFSIGPSGLARDLVNRGLASVQILDSRGTYSKNKNN